MLLALTKNLYANQIDNIKTDEDLDNFFRINLKGFEDFTIASLTQLYPNSTHKKIADSLGIIPWQKVDLDNNGLTDLLVYGIWQEENYFIAIIDEGDKITYRLFDKSVLKNVLFPELTTINQQVVLILHHACKYDCEKKGPILKRDTLTYKFGNFIETNFTTNTYNIKKIEFSTTMCAGNCPVFQLEIIPFGTSKFNADFNNEIKGKFKAIIDTSSLNSLLTLLNYIDFPCLKNHYTVPGTCYPESTLKISYDKGKTKTITDYGEIGTFGLIMLYKKLFSLRTNQDWKK